MEPKNIQEYVSLLIQDQKENPNNRTFTISNVPKEYRAAVGRELRRSFGGNIGDKQLAEAANTIAMSIPVIAGISASPTFFSIADLTNSAASGDFLGALLSVADIVPGNPIQKYITSKKILKVIEETPLDQTFPTNVGWAPSQKATWWHHSATYNPKFKAIHPSRWDAKLHNATPQGVFFTKDAGTGGFLKNRPWHGLYEIEMKKPMVQVGETRSVVKNIPRNKIVKFAQDNNADGIIFTGISDNQLKSQDILHYFSGMDSDGNAIGIEFVKGVWEPGKIK